MMRDEAKEVPIGDEIGAAQKRFLQWAGMAKDKRRRYEDGSISVGELVDWPENS